MARILLPLLLLPLLVVSFLSCEMTGGNPTASAEGELEISEEIDFEDVFTDFANVNLASEYSAPGGRYAGVPQSQARAEVKAFLDKWFNEYYDTYYYAPHHKAYYGYIDMGGTAQGHISTEEISASEAMGYGLRLANYYADLGGSNYRSMLHGMYNTVNRFTYGFVDEHGLQASYCNWYIPANFDKDHVTNDPNRGPATDGDFDIAYGFILGAEYFWEAAASTSHPYYKSEYQNLADSCHRLALDYIRGIAQNYYGTCYVDNELRNYINIHTHGWPAAIPLTRPSDWMPHHLEVFIRYYNEHGPSTGKSFYTGRLQGMLDGTLKLINENGFGGGFFPDFIIFDRFYQDSDMWKWPTQKWHGSGAGSYRALTTSSSSIGSDGISDYTRYDELGETVVPNHLHWNACRVPWRLYEHWRLSNEGTYQDNDWMRRALERMRWGLRPQNGVASIGSEYDENWNVIDSTNSTAFSGPAALSMAAMFVPCYPAYQYKYNVMRNNYNSLVNTFYGMEGDPSDPDDSGYYADSINAFCLLLMNDLIEDPYP